MGIPSCRWRVFWLNIFSACPLFRQSPAVTYNYDETTVSWAGVLSGISGWLSSESVGGVNPYSRYAFIYDAMGRQAYKEYLMPNSTGTGVASGLNSSSYQYDLAGGVTFVGEGPGIYLYQVRDGAGRTISATSNKNTTSAVGGAFSHTLFSGATYTPSGSLSSRPIGEWADRNQKIR